MNNTHKKILIIEPDKDFFTFLQRILEEEGYLTVRLKKSIDVLNAIDKELPNLVILNSSLPTLIPSDVISRINNDFPDLPILMITSDPSVDKIIRNHKRGLDDYITAPFSSEEFITRVELLLLGEIGRRNRKLKISDITLDLDKMEVSRGGKKIEMTPREKSLLKFFMRNKNKVLSRDVILSRVWDYATDVDSRAVDVYVGYLRKKLNKKGGPKLIHTIRGFGYMLSEK